MAKLFFHILNILFFIVYLYPELFDVNSGNVGGGGGPGPSNADWMHLNAISYNAEYDQIVISSHHQDEIFVIDACGICGGEGDGSDCNNNGILDICEGIYEDSLNPNSKLTDLNNDGSQDILDVVRLVENILK